MCPGPSASSLRSIPDNHMAFEHYQTGLDEVINRQKGQDVKNQSASPAGMAHYGEHYDADVGCCHVLGVHGVKYGGPVGEQSYQAKNEASHSYGPQVCIQSTTPAIRRFPSRVYASSSDGTISKPPALPQHRQVYVILIHASST